MLKVLNPGQLRHGCIRLWWHRRTDLHDLLPGAEMRDFARIIIALAFIAAVGPGIAWSVMHAAGAGW